MGAERRRALAREDRAGQHERAEQRTGPQHQRPAHPQQRADQRGVGPAAGRRGAQQRERERRAHPGLGDHGAPRRARQAPAEAVDEDDLEDHVGEVGRHHDPQRRAQVRRAAQVALAGERDQREREAQRADPQERGRVRADLAAAAEQRDRRRRQPDRQRDDDRADRQGHPQRLGGHRPGALRLTRPVQPRHLRRHPVGQEVAQRRQRAEQRTGQRERRELRRAEVPDDRRVDQDVERLRGERAERGDGQPEDLAVVGGAHGPPTLGSRPCVPRWHPGLRSRSSSGAAGTPGGRCRPRAPTARASCCARSPRRRGRCGWPTGRGCRTASAARSTTASSSRSASR